MASRKVTCEECRETHAADQVEPPCETCGKPGDISEENGEIYTLWDLCSRHARDGYSGSLRLVDVIALLHALDQDQRTLLQILAIEDAILPILQAGRADKGAGSAGDGS